MALLNLDAGEHTEETEALWATADVVCVACGGHAGDAAMMARIVALCATHERPRLGAHPSYPDREGFGRRSLAIEERALAASLAGQLRALADIAGARGVAIGWVKPHGALYHDAAADPARARAVIDAAIAELGTAVAIIGPPRGALRDAAEARGLRYLREGFADRRVRLDGTLVPRGEIDALITDPVACAARARVLVHDVDVLCVHSDTPDSLAIATAVRAVLDEGGGVTGGYEQLGDRAIRIPRPAGVTARALVRELEQWSGVIDVVVARDDVGVYFAHEPVVDPQRIAALAGLIDDAPPGREHVLPVRYDGPDLEDVARATGLAPAEVIARHSGATYVVDTLGFAPGFAYLDGLHDSLALPRRATPRERVPAGSVGIAGAQTAVYPFPSPGGWHLLGTIVGVRMFGAEGPLLALGDRVRFRPWP